MRCPYEYYLRNIQGVKPNGIPRPLGFGRAFHKCLEVGNWASSSVEAHRLAVIEWQTIAHRYELSAEDQAVGRVLLQGYWALYEPNGGRPEQRVTVPVMPLDEDDTGLTLLCIMDIYDDGVVEEHKTTTQNPETKTYWEKVDSSLQPNTYFIAAEDVGNKLEYMLWDVIRAPNLKRRRATPPDEREYYKRNCKGGKKGDLKPGFYEEDETIPEFEKRFAAEVVANPEKFFVRRKLYRSEQDLSKTRYDLWAWGKIMQFAIADKAFPRNLGSCKAFAKPCDYHPICHDGVDPENSELYRIRRKREDGPAWENNNR